MGVTLGLYAAARCIMRGGRDGSINWRGTRYTVEELVYDPSADNYSHPLIGDKIRFKMTEIDENQFYGKVATEDHASFPENMFKWTIDEHQDLCN